MTKKHFVALAKALNSRMPIKETVTDTGAVAYWQWYRDVDSICTACKSFNASFDEQKFMQACKGEKI